MQAHSVPIHAYMGVLVFLPVHTWVCIRAGPQSPLLHIYGQCGRPYAHTLASETALDPETRGQHQLC